MTALLILFVASIWAGAQNALAGGGSFVTLPAPDADGLDARAANITSTVALFPGQVVTGLTGRCRTPRVAGPSMRPLRLEPHGRRARRAAAACHAAEPCSPGCCPGWFCSPPRSSPGAASSAGRRSRGAGSRRRAASAVQFFIAVYGGYFGGGIGFLMIASLTLAGPAVRNAAATKNILAGVMNASAVAIFAFSNDVHWAQAAITAVGASFAGWRARHAQDRQREACCGLSSWRSASC